MKLNVGDILLFRWNVPFNKLVGYFNKIVHGDEAYSHVAIVTEVRGGDVLLHEALAKNGKFIASYYSISAIEQWMKEGRCLRGKTTIPLVDVKHYADAYLGKPYGYKTLWYIILFKIFGWKLLAESEGVNSLICSEAIARILYDASDKQIDFVKEFGIPYQFIEPYLLLISKQIRWKNG